MTSTAHCARTASRSLIAFLSPVGYPTGHLFSLQLPKGSGHIKPALDRRTPLWAISLTRISLYVLSIVTRHHTRRRRPNATRSVLLAAYLAVLRYIRLQDGVLQGSLSKDQRSPRAGYRSGR